MARLGDHRPALTIDRFALYRTADEGAAAAAAASLWETLVDSEAFELQCIRRWAKTAISYTTHVTAVVKVYFAALRQICSVRRSLTRTTLLTPVHALVVTKVDYCSTVLSGISGRLLQRL